ncbi:ABC transporter substrate-binding protein [Fictibacillus sp. NRS-1165]|uniref:ABC transporter substrate-binding protein n=1 Tax=Fictibacillus sp. NRS-1165 TaxID=3144463 RepID=UPI003D23898B
MKKTSIFAWLLIAILALSACSSTSTSDAKGKSSTSKAADEIAIATGSDPISLDPRKTWSGPGYSMNAHIFEPLVFRQIDGENVKIVGVLAEKFENVDPLTWKFTLRKGVKFHNGQPLTPEAVKFTIDSIIDPNYNTPMKTWLRDVDKVTTEGDDVVIIKTKTPTGGLISSLAQVPIVEPGAVKSLGDKYNTEPVGTGPYKIVKYTPNNELLLTRFDDYWGEKAKTKNVRFRIMPESSVRLAALQRGDVQIAETMSADKLSTIKSDPNLSVSVTKTLRVDFLSLEFKNKWIANQKFRHALSLAIDRKGLIDNVLAGTTIPASSVSPPGTIGFDKNLPVYPFDLDKAKQLLKESGYDGSPIKMGAPIGRYAMDKQMGEAIAGMLKKAGVNIQLETLEWSSYIPKTDTDAYDIWFIGATDFTINPSKHWDGYFNSATSEIGYKNPEVDKLMAEAAQTIDQNKQVELYTKIQEILYQDLPTLPLYYEPQIIGVRKGINSYKSRIDEYTIVRDAEYQK